MHLFHDNLSYVFILAPLPQDSAGIWLGKVVRNIRCGHCYCTKKAELESLGFVFAKQPKGISTVES